MRQITISTNLKANSYEFFENNELFITIQSDSLFRTQKATVEPSEYILTNFQYAFGHFNTSLTNKSSGEIEGEFYVTNLWSNGVNYSENGKLLYRIDPPIKSFIESWWLRLTSFNTVFSFREYYKTKSVVITSAEGTEVAKLTVGNTVILPNLLELNVDDIDQKTLIALCIMSSFYFARV